LTNPAPVGAVEVANDTRLAGWAYDADAGGAVTLRLDIDGVAGTPFAARVVRAGLAASRHFNTRVLGFDVAGDFAGHVVELYAFDTPSGQAKLIYSSNHKPVGRVEVNDGFVVSGWAVDPDDKAAAISIRVDVDGVTLAGTPVLANGERLDLVKAWSSADHGFSVAIPGLTPGKHVVAVYAVDAEAGGQVPVLLGSKTVTDRPPVGKVEVINRAVVSGWALDRDLGETAATVNVYVDGAVFGAFAAAGWRPDLVRGFGSGNHGFAVDLSSLPEGSHTVTVTVNDNRSSDQSQVVIFDGFINNHRPVGSVEGIDGSAFSGWAYDPDAPEQALAVDVYVDGAYATTVTANGERSDLGATLPTPGHGFVGALPALAFGTHKVEFYAAESQGNVSVLIGMRMVSNSRPIGALESAAATTVTGWAADPDRLGESVEIRVYVNGVYAVHATADEERTDLASLSPLSTMPEFMHYGYAVELPDLQPGRNQIDVFAVDLNNGLLSPLGSTVVDR